MKFFSGFFFKEVNVKCECRFFIGTNLIWHNTVIVAAATIILTLKKVTSTTSIQT
jgi:hypothetical protein